MRNAGRPDSRPTNEKWGIRYMKTVRFGAILVVVLSASNQGMRTIRFSGTVAEIKHSLHTSIVSDGASYANTSDPVVPAEIAPTVGAIFGLSRIETLANANAGASFSDAIVNAQGPNF